MPQASVFGSYIEGPFHGLAFDGGTFHLGILSDAAITIGGVPVHTRVRKSGLTIHDVLNDAPNTCTLVMEGDGPAVGQPLRITINEGLVLFAGQVQTVDQAFESKPEHVAWAVTAIDDTAKANYRRPFGTWVQTSATTIAQAISTTYAPAFSQAGIEAALPPVSIVFDGSDTFIAAIVRLASAIGGYAKVEDGVIYLFLEDLAAAPDPIDEAHRFLHTPAIQANVDSSQLRTRVYGKGYGENVLADLAIGETLVPIQDGVTFPPLGGLGILATTADGAQSEKIAYTGVTLAAGGTLVGTGASPTTAPGVSVAAGTGVESGDHDYAFVYVTASGRTLPSPRARITVGVMSPPPTPLTAGATYAGPGNLMTEGTHRYYVLFKTATGTTLPGPVSNTVTAVATTAAPGGHATSTAPGDGGLGRGLTYYYKSTWYRPADGKETEPGPSAAVYMSEANWDAGYKTAGVQQLAPPAGFVQRVYRTTDGAASGGGAPYQRIVNLTSLAGYWIQADAALGAAPPTVNNTGKGSSTLTNIPVSPSSAVTHVDLYREFNEAGPATARFLTSQPNGTTSIVDGLGNASLGGLMPSTATATGNRVTVTWPAGPTAVTNVELFRTAIGSTTLKLFQSVAGNAAGNVVDSTPDASLTTTAPTGDTSALKQPEGQVNPGSAVLPVASTAPFLAGGGWVVLGGGQVVRYTGITAPNLTGIPATGSGSITTTVLYGQQARPAAMLTGVTGIVKAILKGSAVHIWVQRDDTLAQAEQAARAGGDGVIEYLLADERRGQESLIARCDADLAMFSRPLVTVSYATRDLKTKSGKQVVVNLGSPRISETLTIQDVTITEIDIAPGLAPRFMVRASTVRFSLEDTLRRLIAGGSIVGGSS